MSTVKVINIQNEEVGEVQLNPDLFDVEIKEYLLHDVVKMQLAARRAGTASTKTRVEVSGGGRKPWRQKGTGRARAGSRTSPLWRGGGTVFGPKPRDYSFKLNKKVKKQALAVALSVKKAEGQLIVLDAFPMDEIKTKNFISTMSTINVSSGLIVIDAPNDYLVKSARNTVQYKILPVEGVNVYDILLHNHLVLIKPALNGLEKRVLS